MQVHREIENLPDFKKAVLTIGSFDGVHKGHRALFKKVKTTADQVGGESVIVTFHPHPRSVVYPRDNEMRVLTTLDEKIELIRDASVDHLVIVPFTIEFSHMSAEEYITQFLVAKFSPHTLVVGYDHRFGRNRHGDTRLLRDFSRKFNYEVEEVSAEEIGEITISSTKVRNAIAEGRIEDANNYLSYRYKFSGTVVHGLKLGDKLGFPTANIAVKNELKLLPPKGIYAVGITYEGKSYDGMLYIGTKSTVSDGGELSIEVNIFDFNQSLYDEVLTVELITFIRHDEKYESLDDLRSQLLKDKKKTESILNERQ